MIFLLLNLGNKRLEMSRRVLNGVPNSTAPFIHKVLDSTTTFKTTPRYDCRPPKDYSGSEVAACASSNRDASMRIEPAGCAFRLYFMSTTRR